jgi:hypothetical protein
MKTFSVKNFERFQHYKDRSPPWIKLYNELLEDYDFGLLPDALKGQLMCIWLLASRMENKLPFDAKWLAKKINANSPVDIHHLLIAGFIVPHDPVAAKGKREDWPTRYIPEPLRASIFARDNNMCCQCSSTDNLEIDHIIPVSKGGTGEESNLQVLCRSCNRKKRALLGYADAEQVATQKDFPRSLERETERETEQRREEEKESPLRSDDWPKDYGDQFWQAYPRKTEKLSAMKKLATLRKSGIVTFADLMAGVKRYAAAGTEPQYTKHPTTWLNAGCWADEPQTGGGSVKGNRNTHKTGHDAMFAVLARKAREIAGDGEMAGPADASELPLGNGAVRSGTQRPDGATTRNSEDHDRGESGSGRVLEGEVIAPGETHDGLSRNWRHH